MMGIVFSASFVQPQVFGTDNVIKIKFSYLSRCYVQRSNDMKKFMRRHIDEQINYVFFGPFNKEIIRRIRMLPCSDDPIVDSRLITIKIINKSIFVDR